MNREFIKNKDGTITVKVVDEIVYTEKQLKDIYTNFIRTLENYKLKREATEEQIRSGKELMKQIDFAVKTLKSDMQIFEENMCRLGYKKEDFMQKKEST